MANYKSLPVPSQDSGLRQYLVEVHKYPMLTHEEEYKLAKALIDEGDINSAHKLVTSHLRLASKIALNYRGYGLPLVDLISEANIGLMQAVKRFDPEKGFRLATYAGWWIRAQVQDFILRTWSLVKLGTTTSQKKLFFNLRKARELIGVVDSNNLKPKEIQKIAEMMSVSEKEVIQMNDRLSAQDSSLNASISFDDSTTERQDMLVDPNADQETVYAEKDEFDFRKKLLYDSLDVLKEREKDIFIKRRLTEPTVTLEILSQAYGVSRERIRQIECRAFEKVTKRVKELRADRMQDIL
ncbi:MAG: RNA polymerase sigma factor RpoH [Paracoccaceae bacterium]|nr:RNA polymerase sigma factor RpoH [Paracoccaceae bacterium]MCY3726134.1 RNA polymerase sigma factor RpoH [Paracoccaceae bacterium]MDE2675416.1 RNA polymerase sigma factor RpoH [Paracoccaceae bacterium]MDE2759217.1 RNA polymerase sigma factor RpoH [Paracoccaceae bacterium]MDE2916023.1 RNA polymerase sigma factor RpoH [Paracoccaceae bacterium]